MPVKFTFLILIMLGEMELMHNTFYSSTHTAPASALSIKKMFYIDVLVFLMN